MEQRDKESEYYRVWETQEDNVSNNVLHTRDCIELLSMQQLLGSFFLIPYLYCDS